MDRRRFLQFALALLILLLAVGLSGFIISRKPELKRKPRAPYVPAVKVIKAVPQAHQVEISAYGTVIPLRSGTLSAQVAGQVIYLAPSLITGGHFRAGEVLLRLDPQDYKTALAQAEAELLEARRALAELEAQSQTAREEWHRLRGDIPVPDLVAKRPQLAAARAKVKAAEAAVMQARVNLARTEIKAPFDGRVIEAKVELGQQVAPGQELARVYEIKEVEVAISLSAQDLRWIDVPGITSRQGAKAQVVVRPAGVPVVWSGRVVRAAAQIDEKTRLLTVYVRVKSPFSRRPPLLPGLFAEVRLKGHLLKKAFVLPRKALHYSEKGLWQVYVVDKSSRLHIRPVEVARLEPDRAVIVSGLNPGDLVVLSPLSGVTEAMRVKVLP